MVLGMLHIPCIHVFLPFLCITVGVAGVPGSQESLTCSGAQSASSGSEVLPECSGGQGSALLQGETQRALLNGEDAEPTLAGVLAALHSHHEHRSDPDTGIVEIEAEITTGAMPAQYENKPSPEKVLERILEEEEGLNSQALRDLREAQASGGEPLKAILVKYQDRILTAIEQISYRETPEQALEAGELITLELLEEVDGLQGDPEENPEAVQGDMMPGDEENKLLLLEGIRTHQQWAGDLWPEGEPIPYCFSRTIAMSSKQAFEHAVAHFEKFIPCLKFKEVALSNDRCEPAGIYVRSDQAGCFASVGVLKPPHVTTCNLQPNACDAMGIAVHELGHNLGMIHEQMRTDSDEYVKILWDNIRDGKQNNYEKGKASDTTENTDVPYDIMSVMHYGDSDFGKPGMKTMVPVKKSKKVMGNRMGLTWEDAQKVSHMYGCKAKLQPFKTCTTSYSGCTKGHCECHQDPRNKLGYNKHTEGECSMCVEMCPNYPSGGSDPNCACGAGLDRNVFQSGGNTFYNCRDPCSDTFSNCGKMKHICGTGMKLGPGPIEQMCPKTCGTCPNKKKKAEATVVLPIEEDVTAAPIVAATDAPTASPTVAATVPETAEPMVVTTAAPTVAVTHAVTAAPTVAATDAPTASPTVVATVPDKALEKAKTSSVEMCPNDPSGTTNTNCACGGGLDRNTFQSGGNTFYNCKDPCSDRFSNCGQFKRICGTGKKVGSSSIEEMCPKTCGTCPDMKKKAETTAAATVAVADAAPPNAKRTADAAPPNTVSEEANRRRRRRASKRKALTKDGNRRRRRRRGSR